MSDVGGAAAHPNSMRAHWPQLLGQVRLSSSRMLGWGLILGMLGALVLGVAISAQVHALVVLSAVTSLAGWICVAIGVTRLAAKADNAYALWVRTQYREYLRDHPEEVSMGRPAVPEGDRPPAR